MAEGIEPPPKQTLCGNCNNPVNTKFCPHCGQENTPHPLSITGFVVESFNEQLGMDARVWRTLKYLIIRPGFLTLEFVRGRRVSYMTPFRLYLLCTFVFFVVSAYRINQSRFAFKPAVSRDQDGKTRSNAAWVNFGSVKLPKSVEEYETSQADPKIKKDPPIKQFLTRAMIQMQSQSQADIANRFTNNSAKVIFFLLPVFAVLLKILYLRSQKLYMEHLIFVLHFHAFFFFLITIPTLLDLDWLLAVSCIFGLPAYGILALRGFYQQDWLRTIGKGMVIGFAYLFFAIFVFAFTILYTFATT